MQAHRADYLRAQDNFAALVTEVLRQATRAQQHAHDKLMGLAKTQLTTTGLSVSEVAYALGFEHPQSFSKFFKAKTDLSPSFPALFSN